jgi:hypothetical protein
MSHGGVLLGRHRGHLLHVFSAVIRQGPSRLVAGLVGVGEGRHVGNAVGSRACGQMIAGVLSTSTRAMRAGWWINKWNENLESTFGASFVSDGASCAIEPNNEDVGATSPNSPESLRRTLAQILINPTNAHRAAANAIHLLPPRHSSTSSPGGAQ